MTELHGQRVVVLGATGSVGHGAAQASWGGSYPLVTGMGAHRQALAQRITGGRRGEALRSPRCQTATPSNTACSPGIGMTRRDGLRP